jgi:hypothetical protein
MSSPVCSAAIPPDALQTAITTPRIRAVCALAAERRLLALAGHLQPGELHLVADERGNLLGQHRDELPGRAFLVAGELSRA